MCAERVPGWVQRQIALRCVPLDAAESQAPRKNVVLGSGVFGVPEVSIITRLNAARCQLSDSLSTKVKLQEVAKLHAFEVDVSPCREFSIFRWIYF